MKEDTIKIGIPRALLYHKYRVLWKEFFETLGCQLVVSPPTNKQILQRGSSLAVDESCLSVKIFLGHVDHLLDKTDYILIPRIVSYIKEEHTCTKMWALYDIAKSTFDDINILDYSVNVERREYELPQFIAMGRRLGFGRVKVLKAYMKAKRAQKAYEQKKVANQEKIFQQRSDMLKLLIVSHPYTTYDDFLGRPIIDFLKKEGVELLFSDATDAKITRHAYKELSTDLYWTYHKELLGAIQHYKESIDGILFLMTFPCGPDALVLELCVRKLVDIPTSVLILDEHQGEAGLKTRLESFVDILKLRKAKGAAGKAAKNAVTLKRSKPRSKPVKKARKPKKSKKQVKAVRT